ncbi:MAG: cytochrome P450 [Phycisphaera sp.]|nr:cytochrome P450 [Phycisphaera sp.]
MDDVVATDGPMTRAPGPRGGALRNFMARMRDPLTFYESLHARYGDVVRYRALHLSVWSFSDPAAIRQVLVSEASAFSKSPVLKRSDMLFGNSVLISDAPEHARQRRLINPAFHRQRIAEYARAMVDETERLTADWADGQTRPIHEAMHRLTMQIAARTLFGSSVEDTFDRIAASIDTMMRHFPLFCLPLSHAWIRLPLPTCRRLRAATDDLNQLIFGMIAERRADPVDRGDLLSMLLSAQDDQGEGPPLSDREVRDQAMTLFLAGHETTGNAMNWSWYLLSQNPQAEARLGEELASVLGERAPTLEDVPRLRYTRAVMAESMRLYPPAWIVARQALRDVEIGGYRVPRGAMVILLPWIVHRDARWWPDPMAFRPERWLDDEAGGAESGRERPKFAYFPFSGGARNCIGEAFAWTEGTLVLASIARRWRLRLRADYPDPPPCAAHLTLRPSAGLDMTVERRG